MTDRGGWSGVAWGVAALAAVVVAVKLLGGPGTPPPAPVEVGAGVTAGRATTGGAASSGPSARGPYVHVAGLVRRPGLYRLAPDVRVAEAVERAGGPLPRADLGAINLAARVVDGQQVVVPARGGAASAPAAVAGVGGSAAPISLGSATVAELEALDGIGPTLAARIVEHRRRLGGFASIEQLDDVEGIGESRLASLSDALVP